MGVNRWVNPADGSRYLDLFKCPQCGAVREVSRFLTSADRLVNTWCYTCKATVQVLAGPIKMEGA